MGWSRWYKTDGYSCPLEVGQEYRYITFGGVQGLGVVGQILSPDFEVISMSSLKPFPPLSLWHYLVEDNDVPLSYCIEQYQVREFKAMSDLRALVEAGRLLPKPMETIA